MDEVKHKTMTFRGPFPLKWLARDEKVMAHLIGAEVKWPGGNLVIPIGRSMVRGADGRLQLVPKAAP